MQWGSKPPGAWCSVTSFLTSRPSSMHRHSPERILLPGTTMEADCQGLGSEDRAQVALCVWDPKMACFWGGIPKCSVPESKHYHVGWPERTLAGEGESPVQLTHRSFAQRALSELLAGSAPPGLLSVLVHRIAIKPAHWPPHKLATVTKSMPQTLQRVGLRCLH